MKEVFNIIEVLKTKSGNDQLDYLLSHYKNTILKEVLLYTYDSDKKYKIDEAKLNKAFDKYFAQEKIDLGIEPLRVDVECWNGFKLYLDKLSTMKGVKESDIEDFIKFFYGAFNHDELKYLFKGVLLKDLRINMGIKSFQKVWPKTFSKPEVMLAKKFENKWPKNALISRKLDGLRAYYMDGKFYSRTNKELNFEPTKHILKQLKNFGDKYILDGELLYLDKDGQENFQKGISLVSNEQRQDECDNLYYACFDMVNKWDFLAKNCLEPFKSTYIEMCSELKTINTKNLHESGLLIPTERNNIKIVAQFTKDNLEKLQALVKVKGWEGLMVRDADKPYECKRSSALQKIKKMEDAEFKIVGFKVGSGKFEETLGAITVELETGETVDVGSGFTDEDREYIWNNQEEILSSGNMLKVQFFERTVDKHGQNSLRFPVFLCFRTKDGMEIK